MLHPSEQTVISNLNDRLEDLKKITKQYQKYTAESQVEFETHFKKIEQLAKSYSTQISQTPNDLVNLGSNMSDFLQLFEQISKTNQSQIMEFSQFFNQYIEQYNEKMNIYTKIITDGNFTQSQQLTQSRQNCKKSKEKYDKLCKEIEILLNSTKKNSVDALTGYDLNLSQKNDLKLRDLVKQVEPAEQQFKEASEQLLTRTKDFDQAIEDSHAKLGEAYQLTRSKFIEVTMKFDQHKLLANNWMKGQIDEKQEKILYCEKFEQPESEDKLISQKYDGQSKYLDAMNKILNKQPLTDAEYLAFPEILHRHIDAQLQLINDRIKNQKILPIFLVDLSSQFDLISKGLSKSLKTASQFIQEKCDKDKICFIKPILQIEEVMTQFHDGYIKRCNQQSQFIQLKASCLDQIIKDQKNQEKSFMNMYQKMLKDFQQIKQQIVENDSKQALKENLFSQLKKAINDNSIAIKFSIEQVRANEQQRQQQIIQTIEQILIHYSSFIDDNIKQIKQQEEILNEKFETFNKSDKQPQLIQKFEHIDIKFQQLFQLTEEIKKRIDDITTLQLQQLQDEEELDDKNLEEGSVKVTQKLIEQFRIQDGEKCLASYACAFENKILLQGRMYVFSTKICFHSYFNGKVNFIQIQTLFGTTALGIPANEILSIKRTKSYMLDAALEFKTQKGILIFASLVNRERTIQSLKQVKGLEQNIIEEKIDAEPEKNKAQIYTEPQQVLNVPQEKVAKERSPSSQKQNQTPEQSAKKNSEKEEEVIKQVTVSQVQFSETPKKQLIKQEEIQQEQEKQSTQKVQNQQETKQTEVLKEQIQVTQIQSNLLQNSEPATITKDLYQEIMVSKLDNRYMSAPNIKKFSIDLQITTEEFINHFLLDTPYQNYLSFPHYYQVDLCKDKDVDFKLYDPKPQTGQISKRIIKFIHPVKEKQMFAPDVVHCTAEDVLYYFNENEILLEKEVRFAKIPYADSFVCRVFWHVKDIQGGCQVNYGFVIHFIKSTVFKGKIESGSKQENTDVWEKCLKLQYEQGQQQIINQRSSAKDQQIIEQKSEIREIQTSQIKSEIELVQNQSEIQEETQLLNKSNQELQKQQQQQKIKDQVVEQPQIIQQNIQQNQESNIIIRLDKLQQLAYVIIGLLLMNIILIIGK